MTIVVTAGLLTCASLWLALFRAEQPGYAKEITRSL